jgi:hypothetical protein
MRYPRAEGLVVQAPEAPVHHSSCGRRRLQPAGSLLGSWPIRSSPRPCSGCMRTCPATGPPARSRRRCPSPVPPCCAGSRPRPARLPALTSRGGGRTSPLCGCATGDASIESIVHSVGYTSVYAFTRAFSRSHALRRASSAPGDRGGGAVLAEPPARSASCSGPAAPAARPGTPRTRRCATGRTGHQTGPRTPPAGLAPPAGPTSHHHMPHSRSATAPRHDASPLQSQQTTARHSRRARSR